MQFFSTVETIPWIKKKILLAYISSFPFSPSFHFCQSCVSVPFIITMSEYIREDGEEETGIESWSHIYARFMYSKCSQTLIELIYIFDQNEFSLWSRLIYIEGYTIAHYRGTLAGTWVSCAGPYVNVSRICMGSALVAIPEGRLYSLQTMCVCECARDFFLHLSHDDRAVRGDNCMEIDRDASEYIRGPSWKWSSRSYIGTTMQSKFFTLQVRQPLSHRYAILIDSDIIYMFVIVYCAIYSVWKRHSEVSYNNSLL